MTSDFKPGKAYLIEGKGIEEVKSEIKEWLAQKEIEIVYEDPSTIEGFKFDFFFRYPLRITVKLSERSSGVILAFSNNHIHKPKFLSYEYVYNYIPIPIFLPRILFWEYFSNMIRFIAGKKEVYLNLDLFNFLYYYGFLFIYILFELFLNAPLLSKVISLSGPQYGVYIIYLILIPMIIWLIVKNISLSDKYYIEEYKGEIKID